MNPPTDAARLLTRRQALTLATSAAALAAACKADKLLSPFSSFSGGFATDPTLIVTGDIHDRASDGLNRGSGKVAGLVGRLLDANPGARLVVGGDLAGDKGLHWEFENYHQDFGPFKTVTMPLPGNHDYKGDPCCADAYFDYFNGDGVQRGPAGHRSEGWYSLTLGAYRLHFLNSEKRREDQVVYLETELAAHPGLHHMAFWHKPMFSSHCTHDSNGDGEFDNMDVPGQVGPWWTPLQQHGAEAVFQFHAHRYECFPRMRRNGSISETGVRSFLVGTGGGVKMPVSIVHPASERQVVEWGAVKLTLRPDRWEWQFIDIFDQVRHSGVQICRKVAA